MSKHDKRKTILLDTLEAQNKITTSDAAELLGISYASVRRLFADMENEGTIVRIYGGIQKAPSGFSSLYSFDTFSSINLQQKREIAEYAVSFVTNNDILYIDSGTTTYQFATSLKMRITEGQLSNLNITTCSLPILQLLNDYCNLTFLGGLYRENRRGCIGYVAEKLVSFLHFNKSFLGADGFCVNNGFVTTDSDVARLNELVVQRSIQTFVLLDAGKIGAVSYVSYGNAKQIFAAITDSAVTADQRLLCKKAGLNLKVAPLTSVQTYA